MSTYRFNPNSGHNQSPRGNGFYDIFLTLYIIFNGIATGNTTKYTKQMLDTGYDRNKMICLLLYLMLFIYTAQRIYQVHQDKKNNNNQKQR